ncbi:S-methyl-5-thioribose-1-phosphate isomerase [Alienimonas californiensis]|uniref:Methylthioribose-1-phosphate isomerase n=1 Tax=Alienimonas californiensis TaxID=2527989 RepID=A0A517PFS2_9PLAN|nr:S-methyl-5-thioribose-1-phosphate isomerase [Alienimonas californiensis]QDT18208.1 Methylthioribose-1-phosphate isomerase [Alienimonas californiensis]
MSESSPPAAPPTLRWVGDALTGSLELLDQTRLPGEVVTLSCRTDEDVFGAIRRLSVRGAPAIGVSAAFGLLLGVRQALAPTPGPMKGDRAAFDAALAASAEKLAASRPTAVNLFWALARCRRALSAEPDLSPGDALVRLLEEAQAIEAEDRAMCAAIGRHGADLLPEPAGDGELGLLTHCNAGGLATAGDGTALAVLFEAHRRATDAGRRVRVYADETRPLLQGARLTAWELTRRGVPTTVLCDSAAASLLATGRVHAVVTGADRVAANGDAANKIGTFPLAVLAHRFHVPFYIAAPTSTFDRELASGKEIPIEQRDAAEVLNYGGLRTAADGAEAYNPAFDVTPADLIAALVTERGVIPSPTAEAVAAHLADA